MEHHIPILAHASDGRLDVVADGVAITPDRGTALGDAFIELDAFGTSLLFRSELCIWKISGIAPYTWNEVFHKAHIDMQAARRLTTIFVCSLSC